jgi:OFA family oxalate/formate antiporter-like MFS transporter
MKMDSLSKKPRVPYSYWVLGFAFICAFVYSGCGLGAFSLFVSSLQREFGWDRGEVMAGFTFFYVLVGIMAPLVGGLIDRYGVKGIISAGSFLVGVAFVLLSLIGKLWQFYGAYALIGIGMAGISHVSTSTLVSNWFKKRPGTAIGIMATGMGAGILVISFLYGTYMIPHLGWRKSYLSMAIFTCVLIPLALLVLRKNPADMEPHTDGNIVSGSKTVTKPFHPSINGLSARVALGTSTFWLLGTIFFINGFVSVGVIQNQVPHLQDIGFSLAKASIVLMGSGFANTFGKFIFGWLCDQIHAKYACVICFVLLAAATLMLMNIKVTSSLTVLWVYAIVLGLGCGGYLPTLSMLVNINFGLSSYGAIFGMVVLILNTGAAVGPFFAGYLYSTTDSYYGAFIVFLVLNAIAIPLLLSLRPPRLSNREPTKSYS